MLSVSYLASNVSTFEAVYVSGNKWIMTLAFDTDRKQGRSLVCNEMQDGSLYEQWRLSCEKWASRLSVRAAYYDPQLCFIVRRSPVAVVIMAAAKEELGWRVKSDKVRVVRREVRVGGWVDQTPDFHTGDCRSFPLWNQKSVLFLLSITFPQPYPRVYRYSHGDGGPPTLRKYFF